MRGAWDSIHVVEVKENKDRAKYKLTSTIMLTIDTSTDQTGSVSLAGSLTRQVYFFIYLLLYSFFFFFFFLII
jgi:capping protein beta